MGFLAFGASGLGVSRLGLRLWCPRVKRITGRGDKGVRSRSINCHIINTALGTILIRLAIVVS